MLGCTPAPPRSKDSCGHRAADWICGCPNGEFGYRPHRVHDGSDELPRYDEDWRAIGPVIEKMGISLVRDQNRAASWVAFTHDSDWIDPLAVDVRVRESVEGPTPLVAACRLVLALAKLKVAA